MFSIPQQVSTLKFKSINLLCIIFNGLMYIGLRCHLCPEQYPPLNDEDFVLHQRAYHSHDNITCTESVNTALPVTDSKSTEALNTLSSLGIQSCVPLTQLISQAGEYFGLPAVSLEGANITT